MKIIWRQVFLRILCGFALAAILGTLSDSLFLWLFLFTTALLFWQLYQLYRFHKWLKRSGKSSPPEASGVWGDVFNSVHRLQKKQKKSKKRMQKALSRIEQSTAALKEGVIMADNTGKLEWWNKSATELLGLLKKVDRGQFITNIVRSPDFYRYFTQKRFGEPLIITSPVSETTFLEIQTTLYSQNDHLIFIRDVTRLQTLEKMRKDFVANASHELKTPLTVIKGYLETLAMFQDALPERMQKGVENMTEQSNRMEQLIEDLLLLSRLESREQENNLQWHPISSIITAVNHAAQPLTSEKHQINVIIENEDEIYGIYSELYSALSNLITNAIKYSPNGGEIIVKWHRTETNAIFSVQDHGLGIDPQYIPRLTERFFRVDKGRGSNTGGTGLGLAIVKHALLHHDSKLLISSEINKGSTFSCHFPLHRVRDEKQEPIAVD